VLNGRLISVRSDVQLVPGPYVTSASPVYRYTVRRGFLHRLFGGLALRSCPPCGEGPAASAPATDSTSRLRARLRPCEPRRFVGEDRIYRAYRFARGGSRVITPEVLALQLKAAEYIVPWAARTDRKATVRTSAALRVRPESDNPNDDACDASGKRRARSDWSRGSAKRGAPRSESAARPKPLPSTARRRREPSQGKLPNEPGLIPCKCTGDDSGILAAQS